VIKYIDKSDNKLVKYLYDISLESTHTQLLSWYIKALFAIDKSSGLVLVQLLWYKSKDIKELNLLYQFLDQLDDNKKLILAKKTLFCDISHKSYLSCNLLLKSKHSLNLEEQIRFLLITKPKDIQNIKNQKVGIILSKEINAAYKMQVYEAIRYIDTKYIEDILERWDSFLLSSKIALAKIIFGKDDNNLQFIIIRHICDKHPKSETDTILNAIKEC
jgi:hypothetical protein